MEGSVGPSVLVGVMMVSVGDKVLDEGRGVLVGATVGSGQAVVTSWIT